MVPGITRREGQLTVRSKMRLKAARGRESHQERRAAPISVVKVFPPFVVGVADHAHDVAAGVQGEGPRLTQ